MALNERELTLEMPSGTIEVSRGTGHPVSITFREKPTERNKYEVGNESTLFFETWGDIDDFIAGLKYISKD